MLPKSNLVILIVAVAMAAVISGRPRTAAGQIFIANGSTGTIGERECNPSLDRFQLQLI